MNKPALRKVKTKSLETAGAVSPVGHLAGHGSKRRRKECDRWPLVFTSVRRIRALLLRRESLLRDSSFLGASV